MNNKTGVVCDFQTAAVSPLPFLVGFRLSSPQFTHGTPQIKCRLFRTAGQKDYIQKTVFMFRQNIPVAVFGTRYGFPLQTRLIPHAVCIIDADASLQKSLCEL